MCGILESWAPIIRAPVGRRTPAGWLRFHASCSVLVGYRHGDGNPNLPIHRANEKNTWPSNTHHVRILAVAPIGLANRSEKKRREEP